MVLITGPVRSGKSRFAERLAHDRGAGVVYVATGRVDPADLEWTERIAHHVARRPAAWRTVETALPGAAPLEAILAEATAADTLVIDSLGTWVADAIEPGRGAAEIEHRVRAGVDALLACRAYTIVVGEEAGWGIVPEYPSARLFRDVMGRAQQRLAQGSQAAYLVVAGYALDVQAMGRRIDP